MIFPGFINGPRRTTPDASPAVRAILFNLPIISRRWRERQIGHHAAEPASRSPFGDQRPIKAQRSQAGDKGYMTFGPVAASIHDGKTRIQGGNHRQNSLIPQPFGSGLRQSIVEGLPLNPAVQPFDRWQSRLTIRLPDDWREWQKIRNDRPTPRQPFLRRQVLIAHRFRLFQTFKQWIIRRGHSHKRNIENL